MMNKVKKVFVLVLVAAVVSFGLTGCKQKSEPPAEGTPSGETPSEETPAEETPAGEHPTGEHPK